MRASRIERMIAELEEELEYTTDPEERKKILAAILHGDHELNEREI